MSGHSSHSSHPTAAGRDGVLLLVERRRQPTLCGTCTKPSETPLCVSCDAKLSAELGPRRRPGGGRA